MQLVFRIDIVCFFARIRGEDTPKLRIGRIAASTSVGRDIIAGNVTETQSGNNTASQEEWM